MRLKFDTSSLRGCYRLIVVVMTYTAAICVALTLFWYFVDIIRG